MTKSEAIAILKSKMDGSVDTSYEWAEAVRMAVEALKETHDKRTETHPCDYGKEETHGDAISRQDFDKFLEDAEKEAAKNRKYVFASALNTIRGNLRNFPSAEPEIIRCSQCRFAEVADKEDAQDGYTCQFHRGSIWFSGSYCSWAERRNDE